MASVSGEVAAALTQAEDSKLERAAWVCALDWFVLNWLAVFGVQLQKTADTLFVSGLG